jgi:hypothetical protein
MELDTYLWFALLGFAAQLVDGAIGMAYGTLANAALLAFGFPPAVASASVNLAKVFTNGASAVSHAWFRNVDRALFFGLVLPAMVGAVVGGFAMVHLPTGIVGPAVSAVLVVLGSLIVFRALRERDKAQPSRHPIAMAATAGFFNSATGSFGPFATSALVARGVQPRYAVGTISVLEFFVALTSVAALASVLVLVDWRIIAALIVGGLPAAPLSAWLVRHAPARVMMVVVGSVVIVLGGWNLFRAVASP